MKEIKLTQGKIALVDDSDYELLNKHKWYAMKAPYTYYAVRGVKINGKNTRIWMHRVIVNPPIGKFVDHKDMDGLNNQRFNLRESTRQQNGTNRRPHKNSSSKYHGVSLHKKQNWKWEYWTANIRVDKKLIHIGQFPKNREGELLAARAYDEAAKKYFGEFANLNFK